MRFFAFERTLLDTPTEELPAVLATEPIWPTVDMDALDIEAEKARAAQVAVQQPEPGQAPRRGAGSWQPPMTPTELEHLLQRMRKKWNM
ncbi:hypothetical protein HFP15_22245 [Amycolatopsis sp. K13G38]|uniref:Uncharacterized protein n=1 Tax=Amycolatopsis acididurans TaxID=2724524 RepID=A0ABX1J729_9PSEU|nr:hypothetical protein [Amycolatopsis acididurans]NKQ55608.1 hypothetical protein [Amycolatopsis acididurans]